MKKLILSLSFAFVVFSCSQKGGESLNLVNRFATLPQYEVAPKTADAGSVNATPVEDVLNQEVNKKMIIRDGRMNLKVTDLAKSKQRTDELVKAHGGYYASESLSKTDYESVYTLRIRIPANRFDPFISSLETGEGEITFREIDARDVTDQFVDLETRLTNKKNYLLRYQELLKKAGSIKEILDIEEKIRGLEEEIESTTGRLKLLSDQVQYSTLDLTISQRHAFKYTPDRRAGFTEKLKQAVTGGWFGLVDLILFLIRIWPFWIILTGFLFVWRRFRIRKNKK